MLTIQEVADRFKVSAYRVQIWVQNGEIRAINVSRNVNSQKPNLRFRERDIEEFEERRVYGEAVPRVRSRSQKSKLSREWLDRAARLGLKFN